MNNRCKQYWLALAALMLPLPGVAAGGSAAASARIERPTQLSKTADLDFAAIIAGNAPSFVQISPGGVRSCGPGLACNGAAKAAAFSVTAPGRFNYAISLPTSVTLTSGAGSMTVTNFRTNKWGNIGATSISGQDSFSVGARLAIGAGQAPGTYTGSYDVTIIYN